jgi:CMP-N-acetylneuraminic acid synthetase
MDAVGFIFARAGSKGVPGKNIRNFAGKPLIAWSIDHAKKVKRLRRIIVSTDSHEIARIALAHGAEVPFIRPEALALDDTPEWLAWQHAIRMVEKEEGRLPNVIVSLPTTAPLRDPLDVENCLDEFSKGGADAVITVSEAYRNPWFNMVKSSPDGTVGLVNKLGERDVFRRQDAPTVYDMATVAYVADPKFILSHTSLFSGKLRAVEVPRERSIDLDSLYDFELAEFLMQRRMEGSK